MGSIIPPIEIYLDMLLAELIAQSATKILSNLAGLSLRPDPNDRSKSEVVWFVTNWTKDLQDAIDGFETKPTRKKRGRSPTTVIQTGPLRPVPHPGRRKRIGLGEPVLKPGPLGPVPTLAGEKEMGWGQRSQSRDGPLRERSVGYSRPTPKAPD